MATATASGSQASQPATLPRPFSYATLAAEMAARKRATSLPLASQGSNVAQGTACAIVHSHDISTCAAGGVQRRLPGPQMADAGLRRRCRRPHIADGPLQRPLMMFLLHSAIAGAEDILAGHGCASWLCTGI